MSAQSYTLALPKAQMTSVVFASPHSGRDYSRSFLRRTVLDDLVIRSSEDAFMDLLIAEAPEFGAPLLQANLPRAYLDLNRARDELDPAVVHNVKSVPHNPRISSGLGVIPRVVSNGRAIYRGKISRHEAESRIDLVWQPYHDCLQQLLDHTRAQFGEAVLVDFHSMPHEASDTVSQPGFARPQVVLGDRFGAAASGEIVERIEGVFLDAGLRVSRNAPFAGAYIVQHYGRPSRRQHAIQIEIDRSLYMNETTIRPNSDFAAFQELMTKVIAQIADLGSNQIPLAAE